MEIITNILETKIEQGTAVALGKFDGLHRGHQSLLEEINKQKECGLTSCVFTFDPSPAVFFGLSDGKELTTKEEKRNLLEKMGIDILVEYPLNKETASVLPEDFIKEILVDRMNTKYIAAGVDVSFGYKGKGDEKLLRMMSGEYGYDVTIIDKLVLEEEIVSSTLVRKQLEMGNMELVNEFLGRNYSVTGEVIHGKKLGRTIGMPTVNILPVQNKLLPPNGVYASCVLWHGKEYPSITNVGYKPTVSQKEELGMETYIYDFEEEIYGEEITVSLYHYLRQEKRFHSVNELQEQMQLDLKNGKEYYKKNSNYVKFV